MKRLSSLLGRIERFFIQFSIYLHAKNIVFAYDHHYEQYLGMSLSEEIFNDAKSIIFLWRGKDYK